MIIGNRDVTNPLEVIECIVAFDSKDYSVRPRDRMLCAIVFGWDDEQYTRFGWDNETINEYKELHKRFEELSRIDEQPQVGGWIPVTYHIPTREDGDEVLYAYILDCPMPEEGQEILVSFNGIVDMDVCCYDEGWYLDNRGDWTDVDAWMPLPEPYKESEEE